MNFEERVNKLYQDYPVQPYIAVDRDLGGWFLKGKPVPRRNMLPLEGGLLAGDIILLWRIQFGTFTTESVYPKYFEYTYGINAEDRLSHLLMNDYVILDSPFESLRHLNTTIKKNILKSKNVTGLSKMKSVDLNQALENYFSEEELGKHFSIRGYRLTEKGRLALLDNQDVVDRHPKKSF
ncbi:hypothetical protein STRDD10_00446 [Streptococcus sp. DD10]|uniref:hypothetical protein n=1 Tax=Streptococcus sp. DD10 TaxID=1777878 RepID=UPI000796B704|nr:hypothetical protein [Streptococcus sp. DD10]KXT75143.1 hypothetical protein STRDD10_00446 [Streptococcus sp. DD10]